MAQTYTLEEAAEFLGIPIEEMKRRVKTEWTHLRSFRDGNTLRFRAGEIEELGRRLGIGSEPDLQLVDAPASANVVGNPVSITLDDETPTSPKSTKTSKPQQDEPLLLGSEPDSESFNLLEDEPKSAPVPTKEASGKLTDEPIGLKDDSALSIDSVTIDEVDPPSSKKIPPPSTKAIPKGSVTGSEEFKLDAGEADFEMTLNDDALAFDDMPVVDSGPRSGINLKNPADSGILLSGKSKSSKLPKPPLPPADEDEIDFEVQVDASASSNRLAGTSSKKMADPDSEFELSLEDSASDSPALQSEDENKDIFETDFEIPAIDDDSASESVPIEEADTDLEGTSDFDLALDEDDAAVDDQSASEVVELDEESDAPASSKTSRLKRPDYEGEDISFDNADLEAQESISAAMRRAKIDDNVDPEEEVTRVVEVEAKAPEWGPLPVLVLIPTMIVLFFAGVMGYELIHSMWGYHQANPPANLVVDTLSNSFFGK